MRDRLEARVVCDRIHLDWIHDPGDGFDLVRTRLGRFEDAEADVPPALRGEYAALRVEYGEFFDEWSHAATAWRWRRRGEMDDFGLGRGFVAVPWFAALTVLAASLLAFGCLARARRLLHDLEQLVEIVEEIVFEDDDVSCKEVGR